MPGFLTEIWGLPGSGKTHAAIEGWPDSLLVDTAFTSLGFREIEIDESEDERGESWRTLLKLRDWNQERAEQEYLYLSEFPEDTAFADGYQTIILDNAADLRVLAVNQWCQENDRDWPQQSEWGAVNDKIDWLLRHLKKNHHVVVISQMKDEYRNDTKTGNKERDGPKRMDYKADFRLLMQVDDEGRHAWVKKNRLLDPTSESPGAKGDDIGPDVDFEELLLYSDVPEEQWQP